MGVVKPLSWLCKESCWLQVQSCIPLIDASNITISWINYSTSEDNAFLFFHLVLVNQYGVFGNIYFVEIETIGKSILIVEQENHPNLQMTDFFSFIAKDCLKHQRFRFINLTYCNKGDIQVNFTFLKFDDENFFSFFGKNCSIRNLCAIEKKVLPWKELEIKNRIFLQTFKLAANYHKITFEYFP